MSLRVKKPFGFRCDNTKTEPNKKFIFAFEGEKTEKQYFEGINNNRIELGIKDIISIEQLERNDPTRSNQLDVVKEVNLYLKNIVLCQNCYEDIKEYLKSIVNNYEESLSDKKDEILLLIDEIFTNSEYKKNLSVFIEKLNEILNNDASIDNFINNIKSFNIDLEYDKSFDTVCIIIDRDRKSFTENQYDEVISICNDNNYNLGITNPCFEFWLLLHLTDAREYSKEDIFNNNRATKKSKNFMEKCLTEKLGAYKKNNLRFENFIDNINTAIENEKLYCNDIVSLKNDIGSSIGYILSDLF